MRFFRFFVLGCLLLSSCAKSQEPPEAVGPLSLRESVSDLPFCWDQPHVLLNRIFKGQNIDLGQAPPYPPDAEIYYTEGK